MHLDGALSGRNRVDGWSDTWIDRWIDGLIDGWIDGWIDNRLMDLATD